MTTNGGIRKKYVATGEGDGVSVFNTNFLN